MRKAVEGYNRAFELGSKAFLDGRQCAPARDKGYIALLKEIVGDKKSTIESAGHSLELGKAWLGGWTVENIRAE